MNSLLKNWIRNTCQVEMGYEQYRVGFDKEALTDYVTKHQHHFNKATGVGI